ncbi:uncharacterized protein BJ212DRAFT_321392 [Suillus subaureus]|uniref:Secreted protein n=1 Tax=Suillus subaureus TaxID=48587 RepID=A0A9P7EMD3_9AGAM|nr:uncharacterized protein BJ212DRAFT_321392 [Suillus subaureus]KAG1826056.1 hypothetical protein BJ212DRAFT_321392 [Suillus subaureus]
MALQVRGPVIWPLSSVWAILNSAICTVQARVTGSAICHLHFHLVDSFLLENLTCVLLSWGPARAIDYRTTNPIPAAVGTTPRQVSDYVRHGHGARDLAGPLLHVRDRRHDNMSLGLIISTLLLTKPSQSRVSLYENRLRPLQNLPLVHQLEKVFADVN